MKKSRTHRNCSPGVRRFARPRILLMLASLAAIAVAMRGLAGEYTRATCSARHAELSVRGLFQRRRSPLARVGWPASGAAGRRFQTRIAATVGAVVPMIEPVARIRIQLRELEPKVFRRVDVPLSSTLLTLHHIIQITFDWCNYHLFEFEVGDRVYGEPMLDDGFSDRRVYKAAGTRLKTLVDREVERFALQCSRNLCQPLLPAKRCVAPAWGAAADESTTVFLILAATMALL